MPRSLKLLSVFLHVCVFQRCNYIHVCTAFNYAPFFLSTRVYVCNRFALCMYIECSKGRPKHLGFFSPPFGGDFYIAQGHVGTVPTPGAVGAR